MQTSPPSPALPSTARALIVVALIATALGGYALGRRARGREGASASQAQRASIDPATIVPHGTRFVLAVDIHRARSAPSTAELFSSFVGDDCRGRIAPRVQRMFVFARDATLDESAFVFETSAQRDELAQCLRDGRSNLDRTTVRYRGIELSRAGSQRPRELLPTQDTSDVAALPGGLLIAGPSSAVAAIIDRALDPAPSDAASALGPPLSALHDRLDRGYTVALLSLARPTTGRLGSLFANVEGFAVGLYARDRLRVEAHFVSNNFDTPRTLADTLVLQRDEARAQVALPNLQRILGELRVDRLATSVRLRAELSASDVASVVAALRLALASAADAPDGPAALAEDSADGGRRADAAR